MWTWFKAAASLRAAGITLSCIEKGEICLHITLSSFYTLHWVPSCSRKQLWCWSYITQTVSSSSLFGPPFHSAYFISRSFMTPPQTSSRASQLLPDCLFSKVETVIVKTQTEALPSKLPHWAKILNQCQRSCFLECNPPTLTQWSPLTDFRPEEEKECLTTDHSNLEKFYPNTSSS